MISHRSGKLASLRLAAQDSAVSRLTENLGGAQAAVRVKIIGRHAAGSTPRHRHRQEGVRMDMDVRARCRRCWPGRDDQCRPKTVLNADEVMCMPA